MSSESFLVFLFFPVVIRTIVCSLYLNLPKSGAQLYLKGRYSIDNTKILTPHKIGWIKSSFLKLSQLRDVVHRIRAPYLFHFET